MAIDLFESQPSEGGVDLFESSGIAPKKQNKGILADIGTDLKRGFEKVPGAITGLVDIPVAAATGKASISEGWDYAGKLTGFQPSKWATEAEAEYSPARQEATRQKEEAWKDGTTTDVAKAYLSNPLHNIGGLIAESAPSMLAGGAVGRGISILSKAAPAIAGGIGEGAMMAGQAMSNLLDSGVDPRTAAGYSAATGVVGGAIGAAGGKVAQKFGWADPDTLIAGGAARQASGATGMAAAKETGKRILGGGASEGFIEELPQSLMEQGFSNLAQDKPVTEGMARAGVEGTLAGFGMGAAFNALPGSKYAESKRAPSAEDKPEIAGLLPAPNYTGTPSDQLLQAEAERQNAVDAAQKNADQLYAERAAYEKAMQALYPSGLPTLTTDTAPLQQNIDALLAVDERDLKGLRKVQHKRQLDAAFGEVVGITHDADGRETPLTMGALLDSQAMAEDAAKRQTATENANTRAQGLADEETAQQPDISPGYVPPVIPVVGPLSAIANATVQSGAHQSAVMQQAAAQAAKNTTPEGKAGTPAGAQKVATAPAQGPLTEVAGQAANVATPAGDPFIQSSSDAQLNWLAERGKPELKAAAAAEIALRGVDQNTQQSPQTVATTESKALTKEPEIPNGDGVTNAPTDTGIPMSAANAPSRMFDPKGLQPGTPEYNAAFDAWNSERAQSQSDDSGNGQREENKSAVAKKNGWRKRLIDWFNGASHGDTITTDIEGEQYQVVEKTITRNGKQIKQKLLVEKNGGGEGSDRVIIENRDGESHQAPNTNQGIDEFAGNAAQPETETDSKGASLGKLLEDGIAKTSTANQEPVKNQSEQPLDMVPAVDASTAEQSSDVQPASADPALQNRDRGRAASVNQMQSIARNPDYMRLGPSRTPDSGAPMVFAVGGYTNKIQASNFGAEDIAVMSDGQRVPFRYAVVDASSVEPSNFADGATNPAFASNATGTIKALNNGRTAGVRAAHEGSKAANYTAELLADNAHGVSPEAIRNTPNPMLVRVYAEQSNTGDMAAKSQGQGLGMSASERATQDSELMTSDVLDKFAPGDIASAGNRDFVRSFVGKLAENELADMMDAAGNLSQDGRRRIEAALLTAAYGKSDLVQELFESTDTDIKAIGNALKVMSGQWAAMRNAAKDGVIDPDTDMTANLIEAVNIVRRSRAEGSSIAELAGQGDLMGGNYLNELSELFLRIFYKGKNYDRARGGDKVISALQEIVTSAMNTKAEAGLFGDSFKATPKQIVESARSKIDEENKPASQSSLFGANGQATAVSQGNRSESAAQPGKVGQGSVGTGRSEGAGKQAEPVAPTSEMDALKAEMGQAIGELASILGAKTNLTPEEESRIIPVMSKIFRIAAKMGYIKFKDAAKYVLDQIRQLAGADVADKISIDNLQAGYINIAKEIGGDKREAMSYDSIEDLEKSDVTDQRSSTDLEPDSGNANPENGMGEEGVRTGRGGDGSTGGPGVQGSEESLRAGSSSELSGPETAAAGERGNLEIYTGATELSPGSAGNSVDSGSRDSGLAGAPVEPDAAKATRQSATGPNDLKEKVLAQAKADKNATNKEGIEAIRAALPILTENQQDDVAKAETRFAEPDGYGMLFTNGTGTGKTFTGLGVIKRFANQGKKNILIVAPNDKIIEDWQKSGALLGLDLSRLADTNDAGKGIVITTYANMGQNNALAKRDWDLVVHDEAHYLAMDKDGTNTNALKNLRAVSLHPGGVFKRHLMINAEDIQRLAELDADAKMQRMSDDQRMWVQAEKTQADADKLRNELKAKQEAIKEDVTGRQGAKRTRALFLSATPFAYEKTVDWANGYIFDYNEGRGDESREFRGYNTGSNSDQFMMQHFGYRMRYGKLTQPDAKVDSGLMQRQFNTWLKKKGSLSGRMLDVAADYDRKFILVDSAIGQRIDAALEWFEVKRKAQHDGMGEAGERIGAIMAKADPYASALSAVRDHIGEKFDYLSRRYLLESIKAREVVPHIREHLALGRKIVVFHDYKKGGGFNPFILDERSVKAQEAEDGTVQAAEWNKVVREFNAEFRDIINSDLFKQSSPIDMFKQEFPDVLLFNGDVPQKQRRANVAKFQDDASGPQVILVQSAAGKEGISLHDTTGKHQRVLFNLGQPTQPTTAIQQEGRIYRTGQVTDALFRYLNTGTNWEKWAFATTIAQRASAAENLGMGEQARALKDAFISGFEESGDYRAGMENEGKGGKERDKAANDALTEYDRARAFYFGTQKKTSKTKAQEGADYFATPEPVGLKMVEWADILPGEKVLEPSAGHGAIARWIPDTAEKTAIEPSMALRPRLAMVFDGQILDSDFESMNVVNKFDAIVMNPPFGSGGKTAVDHLAKAATHLRDGGRIVALLPTGPAADKKFDKWMYESETRKAKPVTAEFGSFGAVYRGDTVSVKGSSWNPDFVGVVTSASQGHIYVKHDGAGVSVRTKAEDVKAIEPTGPRTVSYSPFDTLHLVADIKMPSVTFERAGTQVMTRIVVIEKSSDPKAIDTRGAYNRDFTNAEDINDLFDQLENMALPNRAKEQAKEEEVPAQTRKEKPAPANVGDVVTVNGNEYAIEIYTTNDGKDKRGIWMEEKEAKEINPRAFKSSKMRGTPAEGKFFVDEYWLSKRKPDAVGNLAAKGSISPADKAIYGMAAEGKSAAEVLKFIASASRSPFNRQVARLLLKTGIAPSITVGDGKTWNIRDAKSGEAFAAAYDPKTNTVALFRPASSERNMLHELVHAATIKALSKKGMASAQMKALFAHVEKTGKLTGMYGIRNVDEFIAEAFSNPKFQAALKHVSAAPVGGKPSSAWDWFIRVVRGVLGLKQGADNALSQALEIGLGVMRENMRLQSGDGVIRFNHALRSNPEGNHPINALRLANLRRIAAGLERPKDAVFLRVTEDGKAITTGPKGVRIPETFIRFAESNGLDFEARRNGEGRKSDGHTVGDHITSKTEPMPAEYRESGALYFGEGNEFFDRTGKTRYNAAPGKINQTDTAAFKRWFGDSKVVDSDGKPLVVYHGSGNLPESFSADQRPERYGMDKGSVAFFTENPRTASAYANNRAAYRTTNADGKRGVLYDGAAVSPVYLSFQNPLVVDAQGANFTAVPFEGIKRNRPSVEDIAKIARERGHDGLIVHNVKDNAPGVNTTATTYVAFEPTQIKSAIGNNGDFDGSNPDIRYNVADEGWSVSEPSKLDDVIYAMQDKQVDMKRVMQSILKTGKQIKDGLNPYLQEELFHGRASKGVKDFLDFELRPLLKEMQQGNIDMGDFEEYLWNAHAQERNAQIARVNPEMKDGGSGIKTADAKAYLAALSPELRGKYQALAARVNAINKASQKALVDSGLEKQETIDAWNGAYQHYVPLQREDVDSGHIGTGKGFSIRGSSTKRALGSGRKVVDIIANLTMQRERNIVRAEKNRVTLAVRGLAMDNPNADFWTVDEAPKERVIENKAIYTVMDSEGRANEFTRMADAEKFARSVPGANIEQTWQDRVTERVVPGFSSRDNVLLARVNGEDKYVIFNERDTRAMRMVLSLKNLDMDNMGRVLSLVGKATRYLSAINTQYNPVFGVINLIRDTQGALINLSSTPLAGEQKRVLGYTKDAIVGIYKDIRAHRSGKVPSSNWAVLFEEFKKEGGQTGYRDQYANAEARAESIISELKQIKEGKPKQMLRGVFGWLSDYNDTMENAVRLAAYKVAKEKGMSKQQAASLAKNLTVNFNRKGQVATQVGALYAFFNASMQGSARLAQTLFEANDGDIKSVRLSKTGKKIVVGGIMLGSMQALLLAAAGFGDDEPPDFIRERNLIMPIGDGKYLTLAMPLGLHVIPGIGRIATEFVLGGGKDPLKYMAAFAGMFAESFNPIGSAGFSLQTIAPSVIDPFAALAENRDFTGKEIYRENRNPMSPTPGHARAKDVATIWSRYISEGINFMTGGTEFKPGLFSPSPDSIDYLLGQLTGGVGREANKIGQTARAGLSGEDLPLYKIPLVGRFVGDTEGQSGQSAKFYDAIKQINMHESEYKGLIKDGRRKEASEYMAENPGVRLIMAGNHAERTVQKLRSAKRDLIEKDADKDQIRAIDERITATMRSFNERAGAAI